MKLKELVSDLMQLMLDHPVGDFEVATEGCDCDGDVGTVRLERDRVYLMRVRSEPLPERPPIKDEDKFDEETRKLLP